MNIYCTYITFYRGNKLPPFYIGSSSVERIDNGYHGSVSSKKWKSIYKEELKNNPHLFSTEIINTFNDRKEALSNELELQLSNDVVKSKWFYNESFAKINGYFGMDKRGIKRTAKQNSENSIRQINRSILLAGFNNVEEVKSFINPYIEKLYSTKKLKNLCGLSLHVLSTIFPILKSANYKTESKKLVITAIVNFCGPKIPTNYRLAYDNTGNMIGYLIKTDIKWKHSLLPQKFKNINYDD